MSLDPQLILDKLPPELWQEIFAFACIDDGSTGRSLSAVSRIVRVLSSPFQVQSVAIRGYTQLSSFVAVMRHLPPERRRVKFLFISMIQEQSKMAAIKFEYHRRDAFAIEYQELLRLIAPTLEILHACMDYALPFYLIPPQSPLPVLRELTIFDGPKMGAPPHPAQFPDLPRLQHVHLVNPTTQLPKHLAAYPQSIVNLRISATWIQGCLNLMDGMAEKTNPLGAGSTVWLSSPREPERRWREVTGAVRRLTREREWLKLLPERHKYQPAGPVAAREAWLERLTGYTWW